VAGPERSIRRLSDLRPVIACSIEPLKMFRLKSDKENFLERLETVVDTHTMMI
jgi:hypothetical protein